MRRDDAGRDGPRRNAAIRTGRRDDAGRDGPRRNAAIRTGRRIEVGADGYEYAVLPIAGARSTKTYRCPGCDHEIASGRGHLVVWRSERGDGEDRRHWHTICWANRGNRRPTRKR